MSDAGESEVDESVIARLGTNPMMKDKSQLRRMRWETSLLDLRARQLEPEYLLSSCLDETIIGAPALVREMYGEFTRHRKFGMPTAAPIVAELVESLPTTAVQLGTRALDGNSPIRLPCHDVTLQVVVDQWQIPGCYTVEKLASLIAGLDLHPNVIGLFFAFAYCHLASYSKACRIALLTSVITVLRKLGVTESDNNFSKIQTTLLLDQKLVDNGYASRRDAEGDRILWTTLIQWCVWVDGTCREASLSRLVIDCLLELRSQLKTFDYDAVTGLIRESFPEWQPCKRFLAAIAQRMFSPHVPFHAARRAKRNEFGVENVLNWWQSQCMDYVREHVFCLKKPVTQQHRKFATRLPAPDFTLIVPSFENKAFKVHSWIMVQWPFFARSISAGLAEAKDRVMELPSDMPFVVVQYLLAVLYGADPLASLDTGAVMRRLLPEGARFMLQNALLYEFIAPENQPGTNDGACRFQIANRHVCEILCQQLRQLDSSITVGTTRRNTNVTRRISDDESEDSIDTPIDTPIASSDDEFWDY